MAGVRFTIGKESERLESPRSISPRKTLRPYRTATELPATISLLEAAHRSKPDALAIPSRLGCSKLRPGNLREKNPAKRMHVLAIYEDPSDSAAPFPEPADSSTPGNVRPYRLAQEHTAHSKPALNRLLRECPRAPHRGRAGACGEEKLLPGAPNEHIPPADPTTSTPPGAPPKQSQHVGEIRRRMGLTGWLTGPVAWLTAPLSTKSRQTSKSIMESELTPCN